MSHNDQTAEQGEEEEEEFNPWSAIVWGVLMGLIGLFFVTSGSNYQLAIRGLGGTGIPMTAVGWVMLLIGGVSLIGGVLGLSEDDEPTGHGTEGEEYAESQYEETHWEQQPPNQQQTSTHQQDGNRQQSQTYQARQGQQTPQQGQRRQGHPTQQPQQTANQQQHHQQTQQGQNHRQNHQAQNHTQNRQGKNQRQNRQGQQRRSQQSRRQSGHSQQEHTQHQPQQGQNHQSQPAANQDNPAAQLCPSCNRQVVASKGRCPNCGSSL